MPEDAAERQYFYYAADGSERNLADYRNGNGMIWRELPRLSWRDNENVFIFRGRAVLDQTRQRISGSCVSVSGANRKTSHSGVTVQVVLADSTSKGTLLNSGF